MKTFLVSVCYGNDKGGVAPGLQIGFPDGAVDGKAGWVY